MEKTTDYRNRIKTLEYIDSRELTSHPGNWREHPASQADALKGALKEVGIAGALLAYRSERQGGALVVIDGHLRKDAAPQKWPVLILDVEDSEADYLLAVVDPLAAMATADAVALDALLSSVQSGEAGVQAMLAELAEGAGLYEPSETDYADTPFSEFGDVDPIADFVPFKFGDYGGRVSKGVYDIFLQEYQTQQKRSGALMLDDVLRGWLGV